MLASAGALACNAAEPDGWHADAALQAKMSKVTWLYREEGVKPYTLPDPLVCVDGTRVSTRQQWESKRRPETLDLFAKYVYGRTPPSPASVRFELLENRDAMDGKATLKRVRITSTDAAGKSYAFEAAVLLPKGARGPVPAFLLINNRPLASADPSRKQKNGFWPAEEIVARGYATAVFRTQDVDPDRNGEAARTQGVRGVWAAGGGTVGSDAWATIGAWAWGASRVMDYLQTLPEIDGKKVAVIGHSRGGKTALWAAAQDSRFAMAISNSSGCGGAALSRRRFGETVAAINRSFPYWFCDNFTKFDGHEDDLPVDQHQLIALIAPRPVCIGSADADLWADQRGEYLSLVNASPVYALYGEPGLKASEMPALEQPLIRGVMAYHIRRGVHNLTPYDWGCYMDMADRIWGRQAKDQ